MSVRCVRDAFGAGNAIPPHHLSFAWLLASHGKLQQDAGDRSTQHVSGPSSCLVFVSAIMYNTLPSRGIIQVTWHNVVQGAGPFSQTPSLSGKPATGRFQMMPPTKPGLRARKVVGVSPAVMLASLLMPRMPDWEGGTCGRVVSAFRAAQPALPVAGACEQDGGFDGTSKLARPRAARTGRMPSQMQTMPWR